MKIEDGITQDPDGRFRVTAGFGSGKQERRERKRYPATATLGEMRAWRDTTMAKLARTNPKAARGSLGADVIEYLDRAPITKDTRQRREQQLAWWCAQLAAFNAPVLSPEEVADLAERRERGEELPARGRTLGELPRRALDLKRLRQILAVAFAPSDPDEDPTEFASTSNNYRTAILHLHTVLDEDDALAANPIEKIKVRPQKGAQAKGQDARIVAEILRHADSKFGRPSTISRLRLAVLAWVHITPKQLMALDPAKDFHDIPDASREEILAGAVTITKHPRMKGRLKRIPPPETIPVNPLGLAALRAFAAEKEAWGKFSCSPLNKLVKQAAARAQAALAKRGVAADLSAFTLYHLKHSLATTASLASAGLVDRQGKIRQDPGVQRALDHARGRTTAIYTQAAVDPIVRRVNELTALYLEDLFTRPLPSSKALRVVGGKEAR